jgi:hypothetical protein
MLFVKIPFYPHELPEGYNCYIVAHVRQESPPQASAFEVHESGGYKQDRICQISEVIRFLLQISYHMQLLEQIMY